MQYQTTGKTFEPPEALSLATSTSMGLLRVTLLSLHILSYWFKPSNQTKSYRRCFITKYQTYLYLVKYFVTIKKRILNKQKQIVHTSKVFLSMCMCESTTYLCTTISSPSPVAMQSEPATLVAIFSKGIVIIGTPAHKTSVPVVCALHNGLNSTHRCVHVFEKIE